MFVRAWNLALSIRTAEFCAERQIGLNIRRSEVHHAEL